jgi:hypothetical protein
VKLYNQIALGALTILLAIILGFTWYEGKKEAQYLCANFQTGDLKTSVVNQLDTANFAYYELVSIPQGQRIVFQSFIGLAPKCIIEIDGNERVIKAQLQ